MAEYAESFMEGLPKKCQKCPFLRGLVVRADLAEKQARVEAAQLASYIDQGADEGVIEAYREGLCEESTTELRYAAAIQRALKHVDPDCPGSRRGPPRGSSLLVRIIHYINGNRVCRNPGFRTLGGGR